MVKLENVSTDNLMLDSCDFVRASALDRDIYELLYVYDIRDYQALKDFISTNNPDLGNRGVLEHLVFHLNRVERLIKKSNLLGLEADIYEFDKYLNRGLDDTTIKVTDENNNGDILLYGSPVLSQGYRMNQIKELSISQIKYLLGHVEAYFLKNMLSSKREFGSTIANKLYNSVNFYEEQVLRVAMETEDREINLFLLNKEEKDEIVESQIKDIVEYIVSLGEVTIWGKLTDTQRRLLMNAAVSKSGYYIQRDRARLIDAISNYTTLSELKDGVVKKKTLDRFIVKKK